MKLEALSYTPGAWSSARLLLSLLQHAQEYHILEAFHDAIVKQYMHDDMPDCCISHMVISLSIEIFGKVAMLLYTFVHLGL